MKPSLLSLFALAAVCALPLAAQQTATPPTPPTPPTPAVAPVPPAPPIPPKALYDQALRDADAARWDAALAKLDQLGAMQAPDPDATLYWKAYVQSKLTLDQQAMQSLAQLKSRFPDSAWQTDADALALQMRQDSGQNVSPKLQPNDDLKLLAINGLMQSDPQQALPLLETVVRGTASPAVKSRALFVMAQSGGAEGRTQLVQIAQSASDPSLQSEAIRYLGMMGPSSRPALAQIYGSATPAVKSEILRAYMIGGDRDDLFAAAKNSSDPALQTEAIRYLAMTGTRSRPKISGSASPATPAGGDDLWQLYQSNLPVAARREIIRSLAMSGDSTHLLSLAQSEKDPALRLDAVRGLGMIGSPAAVGGLNSLYPGASNRDLSRAVIGALFMHGDAAGLVALARKENDPELKRDIVARLSMMHSKAATDYLLELLKD